MLFLKAYIRNISMKQQEVFKKIGGIIKEINEQYEYLETGGGVLNDLELELLLANSHFLADHIEVLRKLTHQTESIPSPIEEQPVTAVEEPQVHEPRYFEPEMETQNAHETEIGEPAPTVEFDMPRQTAPEEAEPPEPESSAQPEPETIRHELTMEDIGEDWDEDDAEETYDGLKSIIAEVNPEPPAMPEPVGKQELKSKPAAETVPEIIVEETTLTLNQKISAQLTTSRMSDHLGAQAITDLKSAISLNDKLLYIKELFNGYSLAYSEAIELLNRFKTFEEAEKFLQSSYATKNNWADKQATVDKFYEVLKRRY